MGTGFRRGDGVLVVAGCSVMIVDEEEALAQRVASGDYDLHSVAKIIGDD